MKFRDLSMRKKIGALVLILLIFDVISYYMVIYNSNSSKLDTVRVDLAGKNRMLSQRLIALAEITQSDDHEKASKAKLELTKTVQVFNNNIHLLKDGGIADPVRPEFRLEPSNSDVLPAIHELEKSFRDHVGLINTLLKQSTYLYGYPTTGIQPNSHKIRVKNEEVINAQNELENLLLKGVLLAKAQVLVKNIAAISESKQQNFHSLLLFIALINVVVIAFAFWFLNQYITNPLQKVKDVVSEVASGDFTHKVNIHSNDEIGQVAESINKMIANITRASSFADHIGNNKLEEEFEVLGKNDILGASLMTMRSNLIHVAEEEKKRNWINEGLAKFVDITRDTQDVERFYNTVLSSLIRYIQANQGYLYVLNDEVKGQEPSMEIKALYAYGKQRYLEEKTIVKYKQGLAGQAWFDKDILYFTDVPKEYVRITSGIGEALPRCLIIIPLMINEAVVGILEIASFETFEAHHVEFLRKLSETIAGTISNVKTTERTKYLLEQSQQATEEMRAQEEEMRQNMEEMAATTEEMQRKDREMSKLMSQMKVAQEEMEQQNILIAEKASESQGILDGVNATMATIEFTPDGNVLSANDNFLHTMHCTLDEIKGKNHRNFVPSDIVYTGEYASFWTDLSSGKSKKGIFKRVAFDGKIIWLNAIYNPICDAKGKVIRVIKFATDITEQVEKEAQIAAQMGIIDSVAIVSKTDLKGNITYVNDEFLKWSKYSREEVMGKNHRLLKSGEQDDQIFVEMWKTISSGKLFRGEIKNKAKDGSFYWVDAIVAPVLDETGKPKEYIAQRFVINEQKEKERLIQQTLEEARTQEEETRQNMEEMQAQQEEMMRQTRKLAKEEALKRGVLEGIDATMATIEFTPDGFVVHANENFLRVMKCALEDIVGKHHHEFLPKEEMDKEDYKHFWQHLANGMDKKGIFKRVNSKGEIVWLNAIYNPIKNADGDVEKVIKFATDLTEQKQQEAEIEAQTNIINTVAIVSKTDLLGNITYANDEFCKWSGYTKEELMGKNHRILRHPDMPKEAFEEMWRTISSGNIWRGEVKNRAKDGSVYWVDAIIAPIFDDYGKPKEYIAQRFVINDKKEKEERLNQLLEQIEKG